jgi:hypothetical protein
LKDRKRILMIGATCTSSKKYSAPFTNTNSLVPRPPPSEIGITVITAATRNINIHSL